MKDSLPNVIFWWKFKIRRWHEHDIRHCLTSFRLDQKDEVANFGAMKLLVSYLDIVGTFYNGTYQVTVVNAKGKEEDHLTLTKKKGNKKFQKGTVYYEDVASGQLLEKVNSSAGFNGFVKEYLKTFLSEPFQFANEHVQKLDRKKILYDGYRNGLLHQGLPKWGLGVTNDVKNKSILTRVDGVDCINIPSFFLATINAVSAFEHDLFNTKYRWVRFLDRYYFVRQDAPETRKLTEIVKFRPNGSI